MVDLSIICPGIRTENWKKLFDSILNKNFSMSMEIICIGPKPLPEDIKDARITYIYDRGSPVRCAQIAALSATGQRIMLLSDDGEMECGAQDKIWEVIKTQKDKTVVLGKYTEGEGSSKQGRKNWVFQLADKYYRAHTFALSDPNLVPDWSTANFAYIDRSYFIELGGWDCRFEGNALSIMDWANRAQRDGTLFYLADIKVFSVSLDLGPSHSPLKDAFYLNDLPLYQSIYNDHDCVNRIKIDINNWKNSPEMWPRRIQNGVYISG